MYLTHPPTSVCKECKLFKDYTNYLSRKAVNCTLWLNNDGSCPNENMKDRRNKTITIKKDRRQSNEVAYKPVQTIL